jgi:hypothetical protein
MGPLRACLATAVREGLIRSNPARDIDLPHRPTAEDTEEEAIPHRPRPIGAPESVVVLAVASSNLVATLTSCL